ncbi:DNA adenine methylase [Lacinutrix salivirga]
MTNKNKAIRSPLFYVGDKYKLYPKISKYFPKTINRFIEPFTGGGSVFLNVSANEYLLNDIDSNVIEIHTFLEKQAKNPNLFFKNVFEIIEEYELSHSYIKDIVPQELRDKWKKTYYAKFNKEGFNKLKKDYNSGKANTTLHLYILLIFGFNRMLRFNSKGDYNLPVGNVDFNKNTLTALNNYFDLIEKKNTTFYNLDFNEFFEKINFQENDFIYLDPPYLITFSEYNKLWNQETEERLLKLLVNLDEQNINFAISNVTHYKGKINTQFLNWCERHYSFDIKSNYISYHDNSNKEFKEVLITNYQPKKSVSQKRMRETEIHS